MLLDRGGIGERPLNLEPPFFSSAGREDELLSLLLLEMLNAVCDWLSSPVILKRLLLSSFMNTKVRDETVFCMLDRLELLPDIFFSASFLPVPEWLPNDRVRVKNDPCRDKGTLALFCRDSFIFLFEAELEFSKGALELLWESESTLTARDMFVRCTSGPM